MQTSGEDIDDIGVVSDGVFVSDTPGEPSPPRRPGTTRRTTTIDITLDQGAGHRLLLEGRARDLHTMEQTDEVTDQATMHAVVDLDTGLLAELAVTPTRWQGALDAVVGRSARSGFRRMLNDVAPSLVASCSTLALLLDDLPVCMVISGNIQSRTGKGSGSRPKPDVCAGWQLDGRLLTTAERTGASPLVLGPCSGELAQFEDLKGWHDVPPLGEWSMRRARRLDVTPDQNGGMRAVAYLRDVRRLEEREARTVHEYSVVATIDETGVIRRVDAIPHVLPAPECPQAVPSAHRLAERDVADLRGKITAELTGTGTCTHLNDVLRGLSDTRRLLASGVRG